jgi:hypothetical protein
MCGHTSLHAEDVEKALCDTHTCFTEVSKDKAIISAYGHVPDPDWTMDCRRRLP